MVKASKEKNYKPCSKCGKSHHHKTACSSKKVVKTTTPKAKEERPAYYYEKDLTSLNFLLTKASAIEDWFGVKKKFYEATETEKASFLNNARGESNRRYYELSSLQEKFAEAQSLREKEERNCRLTFQDENKLKKVETLLSALRSVFDTQFVGVEAYYVSKNLATYLTAKSEEERLKFMKENLEEIVAESSANELKEKEEELKKLKEVLRMTPDHEAFADFRREKKAEIKLLEQLVFKMKHEDEDVSEMPADLLEEASQAFEN